MSWGERDELIANETTMRFFEEPMEDSNSIPSPHYPTYVRGFTDV